MAVQVPFPLPATGFALNSKVRVNLDFIVDVFNEFNTGSATWDTVAIGTANSSTGTLTFYNSSNAYYLTFQPGTTDANTTYTFPASLPATSGQVLTSTDAGVMSWSASVSLTALTITSLTASRLVASDGDKALVSSDLFGWVAGTSNRVTVADDADGTITLSAPQDMHTAATPTFGGLTVSALTESQIVYSPAGVLTNLANGQGVAGILAGSIGGTPKWVKSLGTANQITVTINSDDITWSLPQSIDTGADVTFGTVSIADAGAAATPALKLGAQETGFYTATGSLSVGVAGVLQGAFDDSGGLTMVGGLQGTIIRATTNYQLSTGASGVVTIQADGSSATYTLTLPDSDGTDTYVLQTNGAGVLTWVDPSTFVPGTGSTRELDNLQNVAINTSLLSDTDNTDDLGDATHDWKDIYFQGSLKSGAGTLATATEVGYLTGVTSAIQTQLGARATTELDNLGTVAINTTIASDTANTDDLGTSAIPWRNAVLKTALVLQETGAGTDYTAISAAAAVTTYSLVLPAAQGDANKILMNDGAGNLSWEDASAAGGATTALDNLASVAINTSLVSDTANTDDIGDVTTTFRTGYFGTSVVSGTLTLAGGSITDSSAAISFGDENLSTTGTLAAGTATFSGDVFMSNDLGIRSGGTHDRYLTIGQTSDGSSEMNFRASTTGFSSVLFGDGAGASVYRGYVQYQHTADEMLFGTAAGTRLTIASSGNATFSGNVGIGTAPTTALTFEKATDTIIGCARQTGAGSGGDLQLRAGAGNGGGNSGGNLYLCAGTGASSAAVGQIQLGRSQGDDSTMPPDEVWMTIDNSGNTTLMAGANLVLQDDSGDDLTITAPAAITPYTLTLPDTAGTNTYVLQTNGSGVLSWVDPSTFVPGSGATTELDNLGTTAINAALIPDSGDARDLGTVAARWRTIYTTTLAAGVNGALGQVTCYPTTTDKGRLTFRAADSAGDTLTLVTNASQAGARTYTIPDAGANADFVMDEGTQTVGGVKTFSSSLVVGTAAIATNATDGFLYIPTCAGTPTGTPTTQTGTSPLVVDSTNNKLYFYSGGSWRDAGP